MESTRCPGVGRRRSWGSASVIICDNFRFSHILNIDQHKFLTLITFDNGRRKPLWNGPRVNVRKSVTEVSEATRCLSF